MHRDIKGGNVLVSDEGVVKLADFGASKKIHVTANGTVIEMEDLMEKMTVRGTPYYMAPEAFEGTFSVKADVWSAGCVAYQMFTGQPPWKGIGLKSPTSLFMHLHNTKGPPPTMQTQEERHDCHENFQQLLTQCFERDVSKRPTVTTLLSHNFFYDNEVSDTDSMKDRFRSMMSSPISPKQLSNMKDIKSTCSNQQDERGVSQEVFDSKGWPVWAKQTSSEVESTGNPFA